MQGWREEIILNGATILKKEMKENWVANMWKLYHPPNSSYATASMPLL